MLQSAEDGEKGIDEDEEEETQNVPTVVGSLAYKLISCLATRRYLSDRCQHTRLKVLNTLLDNFK